MERKTLREAYGAHLAKLKEFSTADAKITEENTYQTANLKTRPIMDKVVSDNLLPESHLEGVENFEDFYDQVKNGKHGLILVEHYSNTDLPAFLYMLEHSGNEKLVDLAKRTVAIAGMKLNEADPYVRAFAESYTRVIIYPTRSRINNEQNAEDKEQAMQEELKARKINLSAMRAMDKSKRRGEVILVFPSGTRYRPGKPETKRGLREIDSYLRLFDIVILVSVHGSILEIQDEDMLNDLVCQTKQIFAASKVIECKPFRKNFMESLPENTEDPKQKFIDYVMSLLDEQHKLIEEKNS